MSPEEIQKFVELALKDVMVEFKGPIAQIEKLNHEANRLWDMLWDTNKNVSESINKFKDEIRSVKTRNEVVQYLGIAAFSVISVYAGIEYRYTHDIQDQQQKLHEQSIRNDQRILDMKEIYTNIKEELAKQGDRMCKSGANCK